MKEFSQRKSFKKAYQELVTYKLSQEKFQELLLFR
jgi:hypothetical protein